MKDDGLLNDDLDENCPILMQKDFQTTIQTIADLPDYLRKINQNIINIDKRISKKELNTDKVKEFNAIQTIPTEENKHKNNNDYKDLNDIVKKSVEGVNDIFRIKKEFGEIETIEEETIQKTKDKYVKKQNSYNRTIVGKPLPLPSPKNQRNMQKETNIRHSKTFKGDTSKFNKPLKTILSTSNKNNIVVKDKTYSNHITSNSNNNWAKNTSGQLMSKIDIPQLISNTTCNSIIQEEKCKSFRLNSSKVINSSISNKDKTKDKDKDKDIHNKNNYQFKPKVKKDSFIYPTSIINSNANTITDNNKKTVATTMNKPKTIKPKSSKGSNIKSNSRINTDSNKDSHSPNKTLTTIDTTIIKPNKKNGKQGNKLDLSCNLKELPKDLIVENVLQLLLFFNEFLLNSNEIKDIKKHRTTLNNLSFLLSKTLEENIEKQNEIEVIKEDETSNDKLLNTTIKLQRKWREYKFKQLINNQNDPCINENNHLRKQVVNNFIKTEGDKVCNIIETLQSTIDLFMGCKTTNATINQLTNITLGKTNNESIHLLYKDCITNHITTQSQENNITNKATDKLEDSQNSILSNIVISSQKKDKSNKKKKEKTKEKEKEKMKGKGK